MFIALKSAILIFFIALAQKRNKWLWLVNSFGVQTVLAGLTLYLYAKLLPFMEQNYDEKRGYVQAITYLVLAIPVIYLAIIFVYQMVTGRKRKKALLRSGIQSEIIGSDDVS